MNLQKEYAWKIESEPIIKHADILHTEMKEQLKLVSEASKEHPKEYKKAQGSVEIANTDEIKSKSEQIHESTTKKG